MSKVIDNKKEISTEGFDSNLVRAKAAKILQYGYEPHIVLKRFDDLFRQASEKGKDVDQKSEEVQKLLRDASMVIGLDNQFPIICAINGEYRSLAIEFANGLTREYEVKTPSEKSLVQAAVNAYIQLLHNSRRFNDAEESGKYISSERTKYLAMLGKQIDRANRQLMSAIAMLQQMKNPPLNVNIRTHTAFVAQNQQLNNNQVKQDETIK